MSRDLRDLASHPNVGDLERRDRARSCTGAGGAPLCSAGKEDEGGFQGRSCTAGGAGTRRYYAALPPSTRAPANSMHARLRRSRICVQDLEASPVLPEQSRTCKYGKLCPFSWLCRATLRRYGLRERSIVGDGKQQMSEDACSTSVILTASTPAGNCQFRAVADQLWGNQDEVKSESK